MNETWLYHYDQETKQQSVEWRHSGSPRPKKFRVQKSAGKVLASIFWDQDGTLLINYLHNGPNYQRGVLLISADAIEGHFEGKTPREIHQGGLYLHENAPSHRALATQKKLAYLGFQFLDHPIYFLDLTPSESHLFPGLKKHLKVCRFSSDAEVIAVAETCLDVQLSEFF